MVSLIDYLSAGDNDQLIPQDFKLQHKYTNQSIISKSSQSSLSSESALPSCVKRPNTVGSTSSRFKRESVSGKSRNNVNKVKIETGSEKLPVLMKIKK